MKWDTNTYLQLGATYRQKSTGIIFEVEKGSVDDNKISLIPVGSWEGSSQEFNDQFELFEKFENRSDTTLN